MKIYIEKNKQVNPLDPLHQVTESYYQANDYFVMAV